MKRSLSILICCLLVAVLIPAQAFASAQDADAPSIVALSGPELSELESGAAEMTATAELSSPLKEGQSIVWTWNWYSFSSADDDRHIAMEGNTSTFTIAMRDSGDVLVTARLFEDGAPLGEPAELPVFQIDAAPEGAPVVETMSELPGELVVGESYSVTADFSEDLGDDYAFQWMLGSRSIFDEGDSGNWTNADASTITFTPMREDVGVATVYVAVVGGSDGSRSLRSQKLQRVSVVESSAAEPGEEPRILELREPDLHPDPAGVVCDVVADLSAPLKENQSIVWTWNFNSYSSADPKQTMVQMSGSKSRLFIIPHSTGDVLITAQLFEDDEPLGEKFSLPVFQIADAPEGAPIVESLTGFPSVVVPGKDYEATASLSADPGDRYQVQWLVDSSTLKEENGAIIETDGTVSKLSFTPSDIAPGEHALYVRVRDTETNYSVSQRLSQFVVGNSEGLQIRPDSPVPARIEEADGRLAVTGIPISTPGNIVSVNDAEQIFDVPEGGRIEVSGELADDAPFATGQEVRVFDAAGEEVGAAVVIVEGDVLGNGMLSIAQLTRLAKAVSNAQPLEWPFLAAGDFSGTGSININDLVREARMIAG